MRPQPHPAPPAPAYDDARRILVVANETLGGAVLHDLLLGATGGGRDTQVVVVVPAVDAGPALRRLEACLDGLAAEGIGAAGRVMGADPLQAISRTLRLFPADLLVIATHPAPYSTWLAHDVVRRADRAFGVPVAHVVVDGASVAVA
jgi:hypothetical protein